MFVLTAILLLIIVKVDSFGSNIAVFGATGGVGQLICKTLIANKLNVNILTRDLANAKKFSNLKGCNFFEGNALSKDSILPAIRNVDSLIISVGTTAFPTKKWDNGNNPRNACYETVNNILNVASTNSNKIKRVILISSVGVERTNEFPYKLLNSYGVLDSKLDSEKLVLSNAVKFGYEAVVIRPGRLVGEPFTNFDLAKLLNINQGSNKGIILSKRDELNGDVERLDIATATYKILTIKPQPKKQIVFSIINKKGPSPTADEWSNIITAIL
eukprot:gene19678-25596_t